jgi:integrase/recombinase XerC/integrase/recombinase XerD
MKLSKVIEEYLLEHQIQGHSLATVRYYRQNLTWFCDYLQNTDISDVTLSHAREYVLQLRERNVTSVTLQTYTRAIRGFLTWCYNEDYISENIPKKLKLPRATRKAIDVLTDIEISRLLDCIDTRRFIGLRDIVVVLLMLDSGMRLSEVLRVEYGKIHLESGYLIAHGRGNKERFVPLGLHTRKYLIKYLAQLPPMTEQAIIVVKDKLTTANLSTIQDLFRRLKKRSGIPRLRPHLLRHTFATRYLSLGGDVYTLQAILGHTSLEMTKRYSHMIPDKISVISTLYILARLYTALMGISSPDAS